MSADRLTRVLTAAECILAPDGESSSVCPQAKASGVVSPSQGRVTTGNVTLCALVYVPLKAELFQDRTGTEAASRQAREGIWGWGLFYILIPGRGDAGVEVSNHNCAFHSMKFYLI